MWSKVLQVYSQFDNLASMQTDFILKSNITRNKSTHPCHTFYQQGLHPQPWKCHENVIKLQTRALTMINKHHNLEDEHYFLFMSIKEVTMSIDFLIFSTIENTNHGNFTLAQTHNRTR